MRHYIIRDIILSDLGTDLLPESKIVKDLFDDIFSELIENTYENGIKWHKNGITYFQQDGENEWIWVDGEQVWSVLNELLEHHLSERYSQPSAIPTETNPSWNTTLNERYSLQYSSLKSAIKS